MDKRECQWRLLIVWLGGAVLVLVIMVMQMIGGAIDDGKAAWGWYSASVLAAPSLLLGAYVAAAPAKKQKIERRLYAMTMALSVLYLLLVTVVFVWFLMQSERRFVEILSESTVFLGPIQGIVMLALGRFSAAGGNGG